MILISLSRQRKKPSRYFYNCDCGEHSSEYISQHTGQRALKYISYIIFSRKNDKAVRTPRFSVS